MSNLIAETRPRARKQYSCMACEWLFNNLCDYWDEMTFSEKKAAIIADRAGQMIHPGEVYVRQFVEDGDIYTYRARPDIHKICVRLIYPHL